MSGQLLKKRKERNAKPTGSTDRIEKDPWWAKGEEWLVWAERSNGLNSHS